ncbi:hypothetical protein BAUCODRAFT_30272 [Baudoinia panamericana UAMH 10762]|uniref:Uncharacterized protein n=1 Tax=Baudoinia panamericana (strain UAMH 10762) TaxID=717646 RepID=M2N6X6_BAUPA|nr:uncharacterized protein BAUCODRAFT_30272 [Baudoinia panamericana UAMH 10762]EMC99858.1 hypothetical protein BAUCODRAFT_30272 [Baudoinia panamericana UAMH 10762]
MSLPFHASANRPLLNNAMLPLQIQTQYTPIEDSNVRRRTATTMSTGISTLLHISMTILMLDAALEMALLSSMVYWLNQQTGFFYINYGSSYFSLHGKPANLLTDHGHTTNGAAGTVFVAIGLGGILALCLRSRCVRNHGHVKGFAAFLYNLWLVMTLLSALLTISALIATMYLTAIHAGQKIDIQYASTLHNEPFPNFVAYALLAWTPENWFTAMLQLPLSSASDRSIISTHLTLMKVWKWNLVPLSVLGMAVCVLAFVDRTQKRRVERREMEFGYTGRKSVPS